MQELEDRLRDSLRQRANDVVPTPALWWEVQQRTSHRRWLPSWQWVVTSAAVAVTAVAVFIALPNLPELQSMAPENGVPGVGGDDSSMDAADDDAGVMSREGAGSPPDSTEQDADSPEASAGSEPSEGDEAAADGPGGHADADDALVSTAGRDLVLHHPDGDRILTTTDERDGVFVTAAARPGSDTEDITVVALTSADGALHLRWLSVVDGAVVQELTEFDAGDMIFPDAAHVAGPVWTPDGESVVWIEEAGRQVTLRAVDWDDGPVSPGDGQGPASFDLDLDAARLEIESVLTDAGDVVLFLAPGAEADRSSDRREVRLIRRADGVYEPDSEVQQRDSP